MTNEEKDIARSETALKVEQALHDMYNACGVTRSEEEFPSGGVFHQHGLITTEEAIVDVIDLCEYCGPITAVAVLRALRDRYGNLLNDSKNSNPD